MYERALTAEPQLTTERLLLRPFAPSDLEALLRYRRDPEVARYQSWSPDFSEEEARAFLAHVTGHVLGGDHWVNLAVQRRADGAVVGDVGLCRIGEREAELGFTFDRAYQGQGLAREAVSALLRHAGGALGLSRIVANIDARNRRAIQLVTALGFAERSRAMDVEFKGERCDEILFEYLVVP